MNAKRYMKVDDEWELFRGGVEKLRQVRAELAEIKHEQAVMVREHADGLAALRHQHTQFEAQRVAHNIEEAARSEKAIEVLLAEQARVERQVRAASTKLPGLVASVVAGVLGRAPDSHEDDELRGFAEEDVEAMRSGIGGG